MTTASEKGKGSNQTEAPTSQATLDAIEEHTTSGLKGPELEFVTVMDQVYGLTGKVLTREQAIKEWFYTAEEYDKFMADPSVLVAIKERAIKLPPVGNSTGREELVIDPLQLLVANVLLDLTDTRVHKKKLQDLGVSTLTFNNWLKQKPFADYMRTKASAMLDEHIYDVDLALLDKAKAGDMKAIAYLNEYKGRYIQQGTGNNVNVSIGGNSDRMRSVLTGILEIIQEEVTDRDTAIRIGERFKGLMSRNMMIDSLTDDDPIVVPVTKANRQLTPELKELMDHGEGYE